MIGGIMQMGILEIIGGVLLLLLCTIVIVAVTLQESKGGLGTIAGQGGGSFFEKNKGKTKQAMLVRVTTFSGALMVVLTLVVLFAMK